VEKWQARYDVRVVVRVDAPPTRAEWVDSLLRRAIVHGELAPGEKLYAEKLAERWGVSPTPLRETFQRLASEGLVVLEPQRGARVAPLDAGDASEIYEMRLLLDPVAIAQSVRAGSGDPSFRAEVEAAHKSLTARHRSVAAYHDAHRHFHLVLVSLCPNARMRSQVAQLLEHSQRFQMAGVATGAREGDSVQEHRLLSEAAGGGRAKEAAAVLRAHLMATLRAVQADG
jgi:DNA-binding GntR family transcriptional regulator